MKALLDSFSVSQILLFIFLLAIAVKEIFELIDWFKNRGKKHYEKIEHQENEIEELHNSINSLTNSINLLKENVDLLIASDKDDIKAYITKEYHYFVEQKGWIDKFSLDCITKRYEHYKEEGGNSFIEELMKEISNLPKQPPQ